MDKKILFIGMAAMALAGCSSDDLADSVTPGGNTSNNQTQVPVTFNTRNGNITRAGGETAGAAGLETVSYNFGAYAFKANGTDQVPIMGNFLVGYSQDATEAGNDAKGYAHDGTSTWAKDAGTTADHKSPWFYQGLGKSEYNHTADDGFIKSTDADEMSANATQPLVYWDHAYATTEFDCYAPYDNQASFDYSKKVLTLSSTADPKTVLYAKQTATSSADQDVNLTFKHADAQVRLAFRSNIPGYRVQVLGLDGGNSSAAFADGATSDDKSSIVAVPATENGGTYALGSYDNGGTITIDYSGTDPVVSYTNATTSQERLHFTAPTGSDAFSVTKLGATEATSYQVVPTSDENKYDYTNKVQVVPTQNGNPGFTIHVTFKLISTVTGEETTVYNAKVYVPSSETTWANNTLNTYRFTITAGAHGTTDPTATIDPSEVDPSGNGALVPIVFDGVSVEDYQEAAEINYDHNIND